MAAVRNADEYLANPKTIANFSGAASEHDLWFAPELIAHFHVLPTDAARPACSHRLEYCFFGGPPSGKVLGGGLAVLAIGDFVCGKNPLEKQFSVTLNHLGNAQALHNIGADPYYVHRSICPIRRSVRGWPVVRKNLIACPRF